MRGPLRWALASLILGVSTAAGDDLPSGADSSRSPAFAPRPVPEDEAPPPVIGEDPDPGPSGWGAAPPAAPLSPGPQGTSPFHPRRAPFGRDPFLGSSFPNVDEIFRRMDAAFQDMDRFFGDPGFPGRSRLFPPRLRRGRSGEGDPGSVGAGPSEGGASSDQGIPPVTLHEKDDRIEVEVGAPGPERPRVSVRVDGQVLRLSGSVEEEVETRGDARFSSSRSVRRWQRSVPLPAAVDPARMEMEFDGDRLRVILPRVR